MLCKKKKNMFHKLLSKNKWLNTTMDSLRKLQPHHFTNVSLLVHKTVCTITLVQWPMSNSRFSVLYAFIYSKCSVNSAIPEAVCAMLAQWVLHCTCMEAGPQPHSLEPAFIELHMALSDLIFPEFSLMHYFKVHYPLPWGLAPLFPRPYK